MNSVPKLSPDTAAEDTRVEKLLREHHRLSCQVEDLEDALRIVTTSRSWRITAPLRKGRLILNYLFSFLSPRKHYLFFSTVQGAVLKGTHWMRSEPVPQLVIASSKRRMPVGWARFSRCEPDSDTPTEFALYVDEGQGLSEHGRQLLWFGEDNSCLVRLPRLVRSLRIDPLDAQQKFKLVGFQVKELSAPRVIGAGIFSLVARTPLRALPRLLSDGLRVLRNGGMLAFEEQILGQRLGVRDRNRIYRRWVKLYDTLKPEQFERLRGQADALPHRPLLSIAMPTYNSSERWLREAIDSVMAQAYQNWELCIADDASTRPSVRRVLEEFTARDPRIRVTYRSENGHISRSSNSALEMARGEFIVLMDHDDRLPKHALYYVAREINRHPQADLIFSDEDRLDEQGQRIDPYFKLGWDSELFRRQNLISHLGVYRTAVARAIGGFRTGYEGSQDWDFALRFVEAIPHEHIRHIPRVLYHWRMVPGTVSFSLDTKAAAFDAAELCVRDHLQRMGVQGAVERDSRSQANRIRYRTETPRSSVVVMHFQHRMQGLLEAVRRVPEPYVLLLHDATRSMSDEGLGELLSRLEQPGVGAVGGRVWLKGGRLENCGYRAASSGRLIPVHAGLPRGDAGYFGRAALAQVVWAIGLDAMLIRTDTLADLRGEALDDLELALLICEHLRQRGQKILWVPFAEFVNDDESRLRTRVIEGRVGDAPYNPNLSDTSGNFCLAFPPRW